MPVTVCAPYDNGLDPTASRRTLALPNTFRGIRTVSQDASAEMLALHAGRDDEEGESAPSLYFEHGGRIRLRLAVKAGARVVSVRCKQPDANLERASARVIANAAIGLSEDVAGTAPAGSGWVTIGPFSFTATQDGGVFLELVAPYNGYHGECWFDSVNVQ
jgi:hypothetical protein